MTRLTRRRIGWAIFVLSVCAMLAFPAYQAITHDSDTTTPAAPSVTVATPQPRFLPPATVPASRTSSFTAISTSIIRVVPSHDGDWLGLIVPETIVAVVEHPPTVQVVTFSPRPAVLVLEDDDG